MSAVSSTAVLPQGQASRQSTRQTRTNPSRTSKTAVRSSFGYGRGSTVDIPSATPVPHGFYPALTHFTDAITALPREFRRHNSLLKEVDAKAWALEDNLLQLLQHSSAFEPVPHPPNSAPPLNQVREEILSQDASGEATEVLESKNRRLVFDRVRQSLTDLMMTADEKNHVLSNANEELDRQVVRLDTIFPYIAGEVSEEARLGSLTHWAYYNKPAPKATANERPRREAVSHRQDLSHALQDPEVATRSELRREAVSARNKRRGNVDADYEDSRGARKTATVKARGENAGTEGAKRRKVERPQALEATPMERTASGATSQRGANKDGAEKKRRAPNSGTTAARKKANASNAGSPVMAPSPLIGTFNAPRGPGSPGPNPAARPQSSRAQNTGQAGGSRQRPSSSASNRQPAAKPTDPRSTPREGPIKEVNTTDATRDQEGDAARATAATGTKRDEVDGRPADSHEPEQPKGRNSKTSTPLIPFAEPAQPRSRPTRSTDPAPKRNAKKTAVPVPTIPSDEESIHEGDDEDEEGEPRYCYCNEISFGEMVACDNDACPREWFHLSCVGLTKPPGKNVKWYCNECKDNMRRGRNGR